MRRTARLVASAAVLAGLALTSACSGIDTSGVVAVEPTVRPAADASAASLSAAGMAVLRDREAIRITGLVDSDDGRMRVDISYVKDDAAGTVRFSGGTARFAIVDGKVAMRANRALWTRLGSAAAADRYAGRWVRAREFRSLARQLSRKRLAGDVSSSPSRVVRAKNRTVRGIACFTLVETSKGVRSTIYLDRRDAAPVLVKEQGVRDPIRIRYDRVEVPIMPRKVLTLG